MESISKVLLLNFLSVSMMAAFHKQKSWIKLSEMCLTDFVLFLDHGHSLKISVERSISLLQSYTKSSKLFIRPTLSRRNVITKRFYYHSHTVSHGCWGNRTNERACQVGGFSTIRVFYIACKRSCWRVKVLIFFLKARLSCQTNISVSKNEKWSGQWTIANTADS